MPVSKKNERISARVPIYVYDTLSQAAELSGTTLNQFLVQSALEKAQVVIKNEQLIKMTTQSANAFFSAIENPPVPSNKLRDAVKAYKSLFYSAEN